VMPSTRMTDLLGKIPSVADCLPDIALIAAEQSSFLRGVAESHSSTRGQQGRKSPTTSCRHRAEVPQ
jgi:hypothetical protein